MVIPTRNRWPLLARAIAGALAQRHVDIEVVVVDDGSTDETESCLAALDDARVTSIRLSGGSGAHARNAGIAAAAGRWVAFLDDDDVWSPDKLRTQLDRAELTTAAFVYSRAVHLREPGEVVRMHALPHPSGLARELLGANVIPAGASNVIVRTPLLRQLGGFDEQFDHLTDWDLWIRLAHEAPAAACEEVLVGYVEHPNNRYKLAGDEIACEFDRLAAKHRDACEAAGVKLDSSRLARGIALGYLHAGRRADAARTYLRSAIADRSLGNAVRAPAALLGEAFRDRFARDTRIPVGEVWWLLEVWHPDWRPDQQALAVAANPVSEVT